MASSDEHSWHSTSRRQLLLKFNYCVMSSYFAHPPVLRTLLNATLQTHLGIDCSFQVLQSRIMEKSITDVYHKEIKRYLYKMCGHTQAALVPWQEALGCNQSNTACKHSEVVAPYLIPNILSTVSGFRCC